MLDRLINFIKGASYTPATVRNIPLGRYSDNNKSLAQDKKWTEAESLFKDKKYFLSIVAFFEYLKDDQEQNVTTSGSNGQMNFEIYQGSKVIRGTVNRNLLTAKVKLVQMNQPSTPVMRRLLEMNFELYYCRFMIEDNVLCMRFDTNLETANPSKLYYGFKELAIKSDKQDDLLLQDFSSLDPIDCDHILSIPEQEKQAKYEAMQNWIAEVIDKIASVDADKFSRAICYILLSLIYRIDFLIVPEGQILNDLEKISDLYFKKDDRQMVEKNRDIIEAFKTLKEKSKEEVFKNLFRSKYTFSIVVPQPYTIVVNTINEANTNMIWYRDNNQEYFANKIIEYGMAFCQYSYSLPKPISQLFEVFMQVNYPEYFNTLGYGQELYKLEANHFERKVIAARIRQIQHQWKEKYPHFHFKTNQLIYDSLLQFNHSFASQLERLNMDTVA